MLSYIYYFEISIEKKKVYSYNINVLLMKNSIICKNGEYGTENKIIS